MHPLLLLSATQLAKQIRNKQISSREVVQAHVDHARKHNPQLNAIVADRYDAALLEADAADRLLAEVGPDRVPQFHGVPCTIKESIQVEGMPHTAGLVSRKDLRMTRDASTVARIRKAGGIILGVTNTSELCMWMESSNNVYGVTNNPYDFKRIVGGSSGGEGSIIGSGASPFGLGADVGGSIRMPAFFNGVFGHKPTSNIIANSGHYPVAMHGLCRTLTTGPLCRKAEDLWPLVRLLAGPDGEDPDCTVVLTGDPANVQIADLTVWSIEDNGFLEVDPELRAAQRKAMDALEKLGATVKTVAIAKLKDSFELWSATMSAGNGTPFVALMGGEKGPVNPWTELVKWSFGRSPHTFPAIALGIGEALQHWLPMGQDKFLAEAEALRQEMTEMLGTNGIFLFPSYTRPAPLHNKPLLRPLDWIYTAVGNVLEMPITQVPLGLSTHGLPLGVQVGSIAGNDAVTIAVAIALENVFGGWIPPKNLE